MYLTCSTNNKASINYSEKLLKSSVFPVVFDLTKVGKISQFVDSWMPLVGPEEGVTSLALLHNQRIERLWRDVYRCVCSDYHQLFYALDVLDPDNEDDLFVLQCMFLPRINKRLAAFAQAWNFHPLRTERNWSDSFLTSLAFSLSLFHTHTPNTHTLSYTHSHCQNTFIPVM